MDLLQRTTSTLLLLARDDGTGSSGGTDSSQSDDPTQELLKLLQNPFTKRLSVSAIWAALGSSVAISAGIALAFSFLRPYNTVVYAPKLKHADEKHAPPPLGKGLFAWVVPLWTTDEQDIISLAGLDAALFLRFTRMCRNIFLILSVLGCAVLIPVNYTHSVTFDNDSWLTRITPLNVWGPAHWALVVVAWLMNAVVCGFLWWNYRRVTQLRRKYFESEEYQHSLHARTLMLFDIPKNYSSDEGIARIIDEVAPSSSFSRTAIARNVKILPQLIDEHGKAVRKLEKILAVYLKDPQNLPRARPLCEPSKKDRAFGSYPKGQKVDAIEYLTQRIRNLELEIREVRQSVDKRSTMPYGFASYDDIREAHWIAYMCRKQKPHGATVKLAPRPNDIIWDNMPLSAPTRSRRRLLNNLWIALLTLLWVPPNAMIAIFLVNLGNLGKVWHGFQASLEANNTFWSIVQGIASPALTSLVYLLLPIAFRRMSIRAGDQTKTGRERHVAAKLYSFFVFNNLVVFSVFSSIWGFVAGVVNETKSGADAWQAIVKENFGQTVFISLCGISTFWVTWLLQRQLGAAIDLAQLWTLFYSFLMRKLSSPTPRELIELTAPPPFDYASYYNYFLFYATVALCYAPIQPLVLPAAALYFCVDVGLKKYLLMYVFVTKTESGGMFWRVLFNRYIFASVLADLVVFLVAWVRGDGNHIHAYAVAPLPFLLIAFKFLCARAFDDKIHYYSTRPVHPHHDDPVLNVKEQSARNDRLAARFGHPALYKPLITPMVHAKAQNILASVYQGRLTDGREAGAGGAGGGADSATVSGYSDTYILDSMASGKPGKVSPPGGGAALPGFEVVPESRLDFEYYKNRDEFASEHGAGEIFGRPPDLVRPDTPGTTLTGSSESLPGTPTGGMGFAAHHNNHNNRGTPSPEIGGPGGGAGTSYYGAGGVHQHQHHQSPYYSSPTLVAADAPPSRTRSPMYNLGNDSGSNLVHNAAGMPMSPPLGPSSRAGTPGPQLPPLGHLDAVGSGRAPGMLGGGPHGYGGLPQADEDYFGAPIVPTETQVDASMHYDYFRGGNRRQHNNGTPPSAVSGSSSHNNNRTQSPAGVYGAPGGRSASPAAWRGR